MKEQNGLYLISKYRGAIMGVAALWILFFHEWQPIFGDVLYLSFAEKFLKRIGFCGVDIFLLLSGIGLTFSIGKTSVGMFYYKRFKRLAFPFLGMAVLRGILEGWSFSTFWKNVSGVHFYTKSMYSFLWFVTAIATLYLLFPLYYRLFSSASNPALFTCCVLFLWLMCTLYFRNTSRADLFGFTNRIPVFLIGILIGWLTQNRSFSFGAGTWCFFGIMLILGGYLGYLSNYCGMYILVPVSNCCIPNLLMSVSLTFLLAKLFSVLSEARAVRYIGFLFTKLFAFFGAFTLELYCVQEWLAGKLLPEIYHAYSLPMVNLMIFAAVTAAAGLMYLVQIPLWKGIERILTRLHILKPPFQIVKREKPVCRA